jgi:presenilin-like A22 family membrane protease
MKHNVKITIVLLAMFLAAQFIGLYVVGSYSSVKVVGGEPIKAESIELPFGLQPPEVEKASEFNRMFLIIFSAFVFAILLLLLLTRINAEFLIRFWFFLVVLVALGISTNVLMSKISPFDTEIFSMTLPVSWLLSLALMLPLAFVKIYRRDFLVHNATELFVYPGIAAIFVPIMNIYTISALLIVISVYDIWAVWHSGIMQRMARYQIKKLNVFSGFFVPYVSRKMREKLKKLRPSELRKKRIRVNLAILGGGDIVFPIIASGVMLKTLGLVPAIFVIIGASLGLCYLMIFGEKKKFYPAMPFITLGIFAGIALGYLLI